MLEFSLKELNEIYYALCISYRHGHFTNHDLNEHLQMKIQTEINNNFIIDNSEEI
jgi:hypothetical protein